MTYFDLSTNNSIPHSYIKHPHCMVLNMWFLFLVNCAFLGGVQYYGKGLLYFESLSIIGSILCMLILIYEA